MNNKIYAALHYALYSFRQYYIVIVSILLTGPSLATTLFNMPSLSTIIEIDMNIITTPTFENCGVNLTLPDNIPFDNLFIQFKERGSNQYQAAYPLTQIDRRNAATSLFNLKPNREYLGRIIITQGTTGYQDEFSFTTNPPFMLPKASKITYVNSSTELTLALNQASGGEQIILEEGVYDPFRIENMQFNKERPLVIRGHYQGARPHIRGTATGNTPAIYIKNSAHVILDYLEVSEGGDNQSGINLYLKASSHITVQNSIIREGGRYNILISKNHEFSGGIINAGFHLIQNNEIYDSDYSNCSGSAAIVCDHRTRFGILSHNFGGGGHIIRNNQIHGHYDNVSPCSEDDNHGLSNLEDIFAYSGGSTLHNGHDIELYGNTISNAGDDNIELDGICSNVRVYKNQLGDSNNQISIAPALPGPFFIHHNHAFGEVRQATVKMNTSAGSVEEPSRNIYIHNNTFTRQNRGSLINLYFDHPEHVVPINNIQFYNNIFFSPNGGVATKALNSGIHSTHPIFDYNQWYNSETNPSFNWNGKEYYNFPEFQAYTLQEQHGIYDAPCLYRDGYTLGTSDSEMHTGIIIPNINSHMSGSPVIIGAYNRD